MCCDKSHGVLCFVCPLGSKGLNWGHEEEDFPKCLDFSFSDFSQHLGFSSTIPTRSRFLRCFSRTCPSALSAVVLSSQWHGSGRPEPIEPIDES